MMDNNALLPPPPRRSGRLRRILLSLLLLASGAAIGSGITVLVIVRGLQARIQHPEEFPGRATHRLRTLLRLSDEQAGRVEAILRGHQRSIQAIRSDAQPRIEAQIDQIREEIAAVLNPIQAARWRRWIDDKRHTWLPPMPATQAGP
jgi:hypothetical protein